MLGLFSEPDRQPVSFDVGFAIFSKPYFQQTKKHRGYHVIDIPGV
jgi:hypothetical protein